MIRKLQSSDVWTFRIGTTCGTLDTLSFMPRLVGPAISLHESWVEAKEEWPDGHHDGSGIRPGDRFETTEDFEAWIKRLTMPADPAMLFDGVQVTASRFWIVEHDTYLGAIELRHVLTPFMLEAVGHIGYNVRPSARGRGIASWALKATLPHARSMGLTQVLLTCDEQNLPSARTIEKTVASLKTYAAPNLASSAGIGSICQANSEIKQARNQVAAEATGSCHLTLV